MNLLIQLKTTPPLLIALPLLWFVRNRNHMKPLMKITTITPSLLMAFVLGFFALPQRTQAVVPAPDGGYPNFNTAEGQNALFSLTTGVWNTALGAFTLRRDTDGSYNTAVGTAALFFNVGNQNTGDGIENTAVGAAALLLNTTGQDNTANGVSALQSNTGGSFNTATGFQALSNNTANGNTANGFNALVTNSIGSFNTATGTGALFNNTTGNENTATGDDALINNTTGSSNIAMGNGAGSNLTTGDLNIDIGAFGVAGESATIRIGRGADQNRTFIAGITGVAVTGAPVVVDGSGQLGVAPSARRFKEEIKPMEKASEAVFGLKPVTFRYKKEIDPAGVQRFGLVAEDVEKVNRDLVVRDESGKVNSVRYEQINAMLLNEFLKEHGKVEKLEAALDTVKKRLNEQEARIQKVSAEVEVSEPTAKTALNSQ